MQKSKQTAIQLHNSFWVSNDPRLKDTVIGFQLRNPIDSPLTNFEYPYQLIVNFYNPGLTYLADQTQLLGGIRTDGKLYYQYGWLGGMMSPNEIYWANDGSIWTKRSVPRNLYNNQYNAEHIYAKDKNMTTYLYDRVHDVYGTQNYDHVDL